MASMMPLLSVYWPYLTTCVLVYVVYFLIFGQRGNGNSHHPEGKTKAKSLPKVRKEEKYSNKDDEDDEEDEVRPLTFPEETPHIPYIFHEISEVIQLLIFYILS